MSLERALGELLLSLFKPKELVYFLQDGPEGDDVVGALPSSLPGAALAREAVQALIRRGRLDDAFFDRLVEERSGREDDIQAARRLWILDTTSKQAEERVVEAGKKAVESGAQVESQISSAIVELESAIGRTIAQSQRAKRIALGAVFASLLVVAVAVAMLSGVDSIRSELKQLRGAVAEQASGAQKLLDQLEEVKQIAVASSRLADSALEAPEETVLESRRVSQPALFQQETEDRPRMAGKLWPIGKTLRVRFLGGSSEQHDQVEPWAREWLDYANLNLDFSDAPGAEIRIAFDAADGSWSYVGTDALVVPERSATMNLGFLEKGNVLHNFGHVLGLIHEHQSPNADIHWNEKAVLEDLQGPPNFWDAGTVNRNVLTPHDPDRYAGYREFDPDSVMMYAFPSSWTRDNRGFEGDATELSDSDRQFARRLYPGLN